MATDVVTFLSTETTVRYREPFASDALNRRSAVILPWGVHRGFKLGVDGGAGDRTVNVEADSVVGDHVAVYQSATGHSLTVRRTTGDFLIDLSSYSPTVTVYVTLYASYSLGATTAATIRVYTEAEFAVAPEAAEAVILGKVVIAATGALPASAITGNERRMAWMNKTSEQVAWVPLLRNTDFGYLNETVGGDYNMFGALYWEKRRATLGAGDLAWKVSNTDPLVGTYHLVLEWTSGGTHGGTANQYLGVPVTPGQRLRVRFYKRVIRARVTGTLVFRVQCTDDAGVDLTPTDISISITSTDASYVMFDRIIEIPASATHLAYVGFRADSVSFSTSGDAVRFDDVQAWLETGATEPYLQQSRKGVELRNAIVWKEATQTEFADRGILTRADVDGSNMLLRLERNDQETGSAYDPPALEVKGRLYDLGSALQYSSAQALTPRIRTWVPAVATEDYTLLWEADGTDADPGRIYLDNSSGGYVHTLNAIWTPGGWERDNADYSSKTELTSVGWKVSYTVDTAPQPWADNAWTHEAFYDLRSPLFSADDLYMKITGTTVASNPAPATVVPGNALYPKSMVKSWGSGYTTPVGGITLDDGFNAVASVSPGLVHVAFPGVVMDAPYSVVATSGDPAFPVFITVPYASKLPGGFDMLFWLAPTGAAVDPNAEVVYFSFIVCGQQTT